jgi:CheY-like chemotaxis protein
VTGPIVFVVMADPAFRRRIAGDLTRSGLTVVSMGGGRPALEWARAARPALVVSDLTVLEDEVYPLARRLRAYPETREVPVVAVGPDEAWSRARAAGCSAFAPESASGAALAAFAARHLSAPPASPSCLG